MTQIGMNVIAKFIKDDTIDISTPNFEIYNGFD